MLILVAVNDVVPFLAGMVCVRPKGHGHLIACVQEGEAGTTWEVEAVVLVMLYQRSSSYLAFPHELQPPPFHHHSGGASRVHLVYKEALNCCIRCHALRLPSFASWLVVVHTNMGSVIPFPHGVHAGRKLVSGVLGTPIVPHTSILVEKRYTLMY